MPDIITVTGLVATEPRHIVTGEGLPITSFRLASTQRRFDRAHNTWADGETNWYTITAFRQLAMNAAGSLKKGERVVVTGKLRVRDWTSGEKAGTTIDIEAEALGHDLHWGTSAFTRTIVTTGARESASEFPAQSDFPAQTEGDAEETTGSLDAELAEATTDGAAAEFSSDERVRVDSVPVPF